MSQLYKIPFYPQIWKLDEWKDLGFKDLDEARYWQNASCGILCLKMAIEGVLGKQIDSISQIIVKGRLAGAYSHKFGWSHTGLAALAISYDTEAFVLENMGVERIKSFIDQGMLVIVSIKWAFEPARSLKERLFFWKKKGGHLALVTGYENDGFFVNHTSISEGFNWENRLVEFGRFKAGFTGRGIIIGPRKI